MNKIRFLIVLEWLVVYLYGKYGYSAIGEEAQHWSRFFSISMHLIVCGIIYCLYKNKVNKQEFLTVFIYNFLLAVLWSQHYLLPKSYYNKDYKIYQTIIEYYPKGFYVPCMGFVVVTLLITFLTNFKRKLK